MPKTVRSLLWPTGSLGHHRRRRGRRGCRPGCRRDCLVVGSGFVWFDVETFEDLPRENHHPSTVDSLRINSFRCLAVGTKCKLRHFARTPSKKPARVWVCRVRKMKGFSEYRSCLFCHRRASSPDRPSRRSDPRRISILSNFVESTLAILAVRYVVAVDEFGVLDRLLGIFSPSNTKPIDLPVLLTAAFGEVQTGSDDDESKSRAAVPLIAHASRKRKSCSRS
jgi:hypothetical protein